MSTIKRLTALLVVGLMLNGAPASAGYKDVINFAAAHPGIAVPALVAVATMTVVSGGTAALVASGAISASGTLATGVAAATPYMAILAGAPLGV